MMKSCTYIKMNGNKVQIIKNIRLNWGKTLATFKIWIQDKTNPGS